MARQSLTLAKAIKLAAKVVKDDDSNVDTLIELFIGTTPAKGDAAQQAIRTAILKTWYCETEDFRNHFREYVGDLEAAGEVDNDTIESNAPAS